MAAHTGYSIERIRQARVEGGFDYKELALPYGTFIGEDPRPAPVAPSWMVTIPVDKCICGNCKLWRPNQCDLITAEKTETDIACMHIWDYGNYTLVDWEDKDGSTNSN